MTTSSNDLDIIAKLDEGFAFRNNGAAARHALPDAELPEAKPESNDNKKFHIHDLVITPSMGFAKGEVKPARLIAALVAAATKDVLLLCKSLDASVYHEVSVIRAFRDALNRGVKVWIIVDDKKDLEWLANDTLTRELLPFQGETFFIRTLATTPTEGADTIILGSLDNYLVVDGVYIRYESNPRLPVAIGVRHEQAAVELRICFRSTWDLAFSLFGEPPAELKFTEKSTEVGSYSRQFFQCEQMPGLTIDYTDETRREAIDRLGEAASNVFGTRHRCSGAKYAFQSESLNSIRFLRISPGCTTDLSPPLDLI